MIDILVTPSCDCIPPCTDCSCYTLCGVCAFWLPMREDSIEVEYGICPIRKYPSNRTAPTDGCKFGETADSIRRNIGYAD